MYIFRISGKVSYPQLLVKREMSFSAFFTAESADETAAEDAVVVLTIKDCRLTGCDCTDG